MMQPFFFGRTSRALLGVHHPATGLHREAWLVCAPLLQEALRCQRALWALAVALAAGECDVLRFDWFGSGDSDGATHEMSLPSLLEDLALAYLALGQLSPGLPVRCLALRSGALPVLVHAAAQAQPVHLVLWDPIVNGAGLVASWRRQQLEQMQGIGRYSHGNPQAGPQELTGFDVAPDFLAALSAQDACNLVLPAGSRILVASWNDDADTGRFIAAQRAAGITVETFALEAGDRPAFEEPGMFEAQAFPRRSVSQLAKHLQGGVFA